MEWMRPALVGAAHGRVNRTSLASVVASTLMLGAPASWGIGCGQQLGRGTIGAPYEIAPSESAPIDPEIRDGNAAEPGGEPNADPGPSTATCAPLRHNYPVGPYGTEPGDVISEFTWPGLVDPDNHCKAHAAKAIDSTTAELTEISLADWYKGSAPDATQWIGKDALRLVLVGASCEASKVLTRELQNDYENGNVDSNLAVVQVLIDGEIASQPPSSTELYAWVRDNSIAFPVVADTDHALRDAFAVSVLPNELLIDLTDMSIDKVPEAPPAGCVPLDVAYPEGQQGRSRGYVIHDMTLSGYIDAEHHCKEHVDKTLSFDSEVDISLKDWYPQARPPASTATKKETLKIVAVAGWCGPCQEKTQSLARNYRRGNTSSSADILQVLLETEQRGQEATVAFAQQWAESFNITFPVVADTSGEFADKMRVSYFPTTYTIDLETMEIIDVD